MWRRIRGGRWWWGRPHWEANSWILTVEWILEKKKLSHVDSWGKNFLGRGDNQWKNLRWEYTWQVGGTSVRPSRERVEGNKVGKWTHIGFVRTLVSTLRDMSHAEFWVRVMTSSDTFFSEASYYAENKLKGSLGRLRETARRQQSTRKRKVTWTKVEEKCGQFSNIFWRKK